MNAIWKKPVTVEILNASIKDTAAAHLGIEFIEVGDNFIRGRIPVDHRTCQPDRILHGGVSVVLAETLGSIGAAYCCEAGRKTLGLEVNANHLRSARDGWVTGVARPVHIGKTTQVWQIELTDDAGRPTCTSRLTMAVLLASKDAARD